MGWDEVPVPPNVTMACPGSTVYGSPPTVTATVNQNATIVFYLDGTQVSSGSGTSASYTPGADVSIGTHTIQVVVSNTNGSGSVTCSWVVNPPTSTVMMETPLSFTIDGESANAVIISNTEASVSCIQCSVGHHIQVSAENQAVKDVKFWNWMAMTLPLFVTKVNPVERLVLDYENTRRFFTVSINRPANVQFYCDGLPYGPVFLNVTEASIPFVQGPNGHNILVNASNGSSHGSTSWEWSVVKGSKICKAVADPSNLCLDNRRDLAAIITATVIQLPDHACRIKIHYNISTCDCIMNTPGNLGVIYSADTSLIISVTWPHISAPNSPPSNSKTTSVDILDQLSPCGDLFIDVPCASFYDISYDVSTACTIFYIISNTKRTGTTRSLICSSRIE